MMAICDSPQEPAKRIPKKEYEDLFCTHLKLEINHFSTGCNENSTFSIIFFEKRVRASSAFECSAV